MILGPVRYKSTYPPARCRTAALLPSWRGSTGRGSTAPYLHDGRATTLAEAILLHGGEATFSRNRFRRLSSAQQGDVVAFLDSLVLFKVVAE